MGKNISLFRFKQFSVSHHRSAMKVGVDGVLIGCWVDIGASRRILDVGTGCGLIALIIAQREPEATIDAIDIDAPSVEEASENISASPWNDRIRAVHCSYCNAASLLTDMDRGYDLIVSNPPYFDAGITNTANARERARHQGELSPLSLLKEAKNLLDYGGYVAMVVPTDVSSALEAEAAILGYRLVRKCYVRGHMEAPYKRVLLQWRLGGLSDISEEKAEYLTLETTPGIPTEDYRNLCRDFYLKF